MGTKTSHWSRALGFTGLISLLAASCIYDADSRCGPRQHLSANSSCTCDDGLVLSGQNCVPCGDSEVWQSGVCVCGDGFTRGEDGACVMGGAGVACDPAIDPTTCSDAPFLTCRDRGAGIGYCTSVCESDTDCARGFVCDAAAGTCKSAAVGQGDPCQSTADCAGKDADYCENTIVHQCIVVGCSVASPLNCSEGFSCCDVHSVGLALTLCIPEGFCPTDP